MTWRHDGGPARQVAGAPVTVPVRAAVEAVVGTVLQEFAGQPAAIPGETGDDRAEVPPAG